MPVAIRSPLLGCLRAVIYYPIGNYKMKSIAAASVKANSQGFAWWSQELTLLKHDASCKRQPFNDSQMQLLQQPHHLQPLQRSGSAKWINCLVNSPNVVAKLRPYNGPIKRSSLLMVAASLHESFHTPIWHCRPVLTF